jgi:type II secretory pathway pseudopilin PulG
VVIAIIGILVALVLVSLTGALAKSRDTRSKTNAHALDIALSQYELDKKVFPLQNTDGGVTVDTGILPTSLVPDYLKSTSAVRHSKVAIYMSNQSGSD